MVGLEAGDYTAVITTHGAAVRQMRYRGRDVVVPFDEGAANPAFRGIIAAPWPNRIRDGRYTFDDVTYDLPVNEIDRRCALHGLVFSLDWTVESHTATDVVLSCDLEPTAGYPFALTLTVHYELSDQGLSTRVTATNVGRRTAPYGVCPHPYLVAGPSPLDSWTLRLPAETFLEVTPDRLLPTDWRSVAGHEFDFRTAHPIGSTEIDHAFTDLELDDDGNSRVTIHDPSGTGVGMVWNSSLPWVQIHTADKLPPLPNRLGLAVEPMTCPPDAFNSGTDLIRLAPSDTHTAEWLIYATDTSN